MIETRTLALEPHVERRQQGLAISGIALPWETPALINGVFEESWAPTALDAQARGGWSWDTGGPNRSVMMFWNHDAGRVLGSVNAGTLQLQVRPEALRYQSQLPASAADIGEGIQRGDITGASVTFRALNDLWGQNADGTPTRRIVEAELYEISLVAWPAYTGTTATIAGPLTGRSLAAAGERRAGKVLSKASRDLIEVALGHINGGRHFMAAETLQNLLASADQGDTGADFGDAGDDLFDVALGRSVARMDVDRRLRDLAATDAGYRRGRMIDLTLRHYESQGALLAGR